MKKFKETIKHCKLSHTQVAGFYKKVSELFPLLFFVLYALGVIIGSLFSSSSDEIITCLNSIISFDSTDFFSVFSDNLWGIVVYELVAFIFGFCGIGHPVIFLIPFIRGVGYGVKQIYLLTDAVKSGSYIIFCINGIVDILTTVILIFCCKQSLKMSTYIFKSGISSKKNTEIRTKPISFNSYLIKYIFYTIIFIILTAVKSAANLYV